MSILKLRIKKIKQETADTKSFYLQCLDTPFDYHAGQFLTLIFNQNEKEIRRSYSLGSSPQIDDDLFITVKRKVNGAVSRMLDDHYQEGDELISLPPSGRFILDKKLASTYFFIAAGSGITPVFSLIKMLLYNSSSRIILINQCRNEDHVIYNDALKELEQLFPERFEWIQFFSRPLSYQYYSQRLNIEILESLVKNVIIDQANVQFYLCGPVTFMRMAQFTLKWMGFSDLQIRREIFIVEPPPRPPLISDTTPREAIFRHQNRTYKIPVSYPQTLLDAALQEGITLPYSCKAGICSTCMATCKKGKVIMSVNEVLTEKDLDKGLVLTCVGYAETDVELDFDNVMNG